MSRDRSQSPEPTHKQSEYKRRQTLKGEAKLGTIKDDHECSHSLLDEGLGLLDHSSKFAEFEKMGIRPYDNGTQIFYEEEYDTTRNRMLNQTVNSSEMEQADFDVELLNELFDHDPANQVRISRERALKEKTDGNSDEDEDFMDLELDQDQFQAKLLDVDFDQLYDELEPTPAATNLTTGRENTFKDKLTRKSNQMLDQVRSKVLGNSPDRKKEKEKSKIVKAHKSQFLEYFQPIVRKKQKLQQGNSIQAQVFKKITGTKDKAIGADQDDFDTFGRRIFYGNVKKQRGNLTQNFHQRWVVMRGWQLYWYRNAGDENQKGILTLPSQEVLVQTNDKRVCFTLPKEEAKDGNTGNRAMSFGDDFNTRIFRNFVSFMIKYKMYAEFAQKQKFMIEPQIERFLKVDMKELKTQYRQLVELEGLDLQNQDVSSKVIGAVLPYKIDREHDQTIREISIVQCKLTDESLATLVTCLKDHPNALYYLNLSQNLLTNKSAKAIG